MPESQAISNPTRWRFEIPAISIHCDFSCDFYQISTDSDAIVVAISLAL